MESLALHGGKPIRETPLGYGRQYVDEDDIARVVEVLRSPYLTTGPEIQKLEEKLCRLTGAKYAVAVSNGTAALHIACLAAGITSGDEVITTPITFAASANCALYCGAKPIFADINQETYNISPESILEKITEKTKAVVAVDFTGQAVEFDAIRKICDEYNLVLIEDGAHSIGTKYNGKAVGSLADMTIFSFHPVKTVTAGEGGAVLTNSKELYDRLCLFRSHGITRDENLMDHPTGEGWYYEQVALGYNYRMTDFQAALLSSQLDKLEMFSQRRKEIVSAYDIAFSQIPEVTVQKEIAESDTTRHLYILRFHLSMLSATRREIFDALSAENIKCNVHYIPVYHHPYYQQLGYEKGLCPKAESLYDEMITLPLFYSMTDEDVSDVIGAVKKIIGYYAGGKSGF